MENAGDISVDLIKKEICFDKEKRTRLQELCAERLPESVVRISGRGHAERVKVSRGIFLPFAETSHAYHTAKAYYCADYFLSEEAFRIVQAAAFEILNPSPAI